MEALLLLVVGIALAWASAWARWRGYYPICVMGCSHEVEEKDIEEKRTVMLHYALT